MNAWSTVYLIIKVNNNFKNVYLQLWDLGLIKSNSKYQIFTFYR